MKKRRSLKEIYADMDKINKRKPTKEQIEELGKVIRKINEENEATKPAVPNRKIAISNSETEQDGN